MYPLKAEEYNPRQHDIYDRSMENVKKINLKFDHDFALLRHKKMKCVFNNYCSLCNIMIFMVTKLSDISVLLFYLIISVTAAVGPSVCKTSFRM